jgi:polar amino acid transport system ATP-binding protein
MESDTLLSAETTRPAAPLVEVTELRKSFPGREHRSFPRRRATAPITVLRGISLTVNKGENVAVIGPSGSGKSTLIRCINLLECPDSGRISMAGRVAFDGTQQLRGLELVRYRRRVGMVFQQFNLFPHMTAIENVALPLIKGTRMSEGEALTKAFEMMRLVELTGKVKAFPSELSGGQQQRVAIARALAMEPEVVLFDEPTSALDPELVGEVLGVMRDLAHRGMTMITVTHELGFALDASDRVVFMDEGIVAEEGPPAQVLQDPVNPRTRAFISKLG